MAVAVTCALPYLGTFAAHSLKGTVRGGHRKWLPREFEMNLKRKNLLTALFLATVAVGLYVWAIRQVIESVGRP